MLELLVAAALVAAPQENPFRERVEALRVMLNEHRAADAKKAGPPLLKELTAAARAKNHTAETLVLLGRTQLYQGEPEAAALSLDEALTLAPDDGDANFYRATAARDLGALEAAVKFFTRATELQPDKARGWSELAGIRVAMKQPKLAIAPFEKALALDPKDAFVLAIAGNTFIQLDRGPEGIALLEKAIALEPADLDATYNAGQYYQLDGKPKLALERFAAVAKGAPDDWHVRAKLVQLHQELGHPKERDQVREEVLALWRAKKTEPAVKDFCREQFRVGVDRLMVFESFDLVDPRAVRYSFRVVSGKSGKLVRVISLGSYEFTTNFMRENGELKKDERAWHLDGYLPDNSHFTYGIFKAEPTYEATRAMVIDVLEGRLEASSSTRPKQP